MTETIGSPMPQMRVVNPAAVLLERLTKDASAGMISTVAVIAVTPKGQFAIMVEGSLNDYVPGRGYANWRAAFHINLPRG